ncbi:hypothetical protein ACOBV9_22990 (plasmid) [Pseudoalteromonas espejiana]
MLKKIGYKARSNNCNDLHKELGTAEQLVDIRQAYNQVWNANEEHGDNTAAICTQ